MDISDILQGLGSRPADRDPFAEDYDDLFSAGRGQQSGQADLQALTRAWLVNALQHHFLDFFAGLLNTHCLHCFHNTLQAWLSGVLLLLYGRFIMLRGVLTTTLSLSTLKTAPQVLLKYCLFVLYSFVHGNSQPESPFKCSVVEAQCLEVALTNVPPCWGEFPRTVFPLHFQNPEHSLYPFITNRLPSLF